MVWPLVSFSGHTSTERTLPLIQHSNSCWLAKVICEKIECCLLNEEKVKPISVTFSDNFSGLPVSGLPVASAYRPSTAEAAGQPTCCLPDLEQPLHREQWPRYADWQPPGRGWPGRKRQQVAPKEKDWGLQGERITVGTFCKNRTAVYYYALLLQPLAV